MTVTCCIGKGVIIRDFCKSIEIDQINYIGNEHVQDGHISLSKVSYSVPISNGVYFNNSRNTFFFGTLPSLVKCMFDVGNTQNVANIDCRFGVTLMETQQFVRNACLLKSKLITFEKTLFIRFQCLLFHCVLE